MSRIIGIDYGVKRCGIAVTDPLQIIVNPLTVAETDNLLHFLVDYIAKEDVTKIVIGKIVHPDGNEVYFEKDIVNVINNIKQKFPDIVIERHDERFTSRESSDILMKSGIKKNKRRDKSLIDKISAVLILQKYLKHI